MDASGTLLHVFATGEGNIAHAEWAEDAFTHHLAQLLAADALHHLANPVDVRAVLPFFARIEEERGLDAGAAGGHHRRLALLFRQTPVGFVEEIIAEPGRMQQKLTGGNVGLRRPKLRLSRIIEAFDNLQLADSRRVVLCRCVETQQSLFHALQGCRAGDGLGRREDREDGILAHWLAPELALSGRASVKCGITVGDHGHYAWNPRLSLDAPGQNRIAG